MFSFFNKFMLRSLFIRSFFILVLPLSTGFAMKEITEEIQGKGGSILSISNNTIKTSAVLENTQKSDQQKVLTENLVDTPVADGKGKQEEKEVKSTGCKNIKEKAEESKGGYFKEFAEFERPFHSLKATLGFFEGKDGYSKDVKLNCPKSLIFFYRRAAFLFFCPLLFNSLLNFIFEIDNKPSGSFFNFFSVGWRTLPFLKIITFDIHFNWFLFAISAWFDFVYFPFFMGEKPFLPLNKRYFISMFLFAFVFDAVSFCVNFKVDDYFYITVNLSYVLQRIVGWLLCSCLTDPLSVADTMCNLHVTHLMKNYENPDRSIKHKNVKSSQQQLNVNSKNNSPEGRGTKTLIRNSYESYFQNEPIGDKGYNENKNINNEGDDNIINKPDYTIMNISNNKVPKHDNKEFSFSEFKHNQYGYNQEKNYENNKTNYNLINNKSEDDENYQFGSSQIPATKQQINEINPNINNLNLNFNYNNQNRNINNPVPFNVAFPGKDSHVNIQEFGDINTKTNILQIGMNQENNNLLGQTGMGIFDNIDMKQVNSNIERIQNINDNLNISSINALKHEESNININENEIEHPKSIEMNGSNIGNINGNKEEENNDNNANIDPGVSSIPNINNNINTNAFNNPTVSSLQIFDFSKVEDDDKKGQSNNIDENDPDKKYINGKGETTISNPEGDLNKDDEKK